MVVLTAERALGAFLAQHLVLGRRALAPPLGVGLLDLFGHAGSLAPTRNVLPQSFEQTATGGPTWLHRRRLRPDQYGGGDQEQGPERRQEIEADRELTGRFSGLR